jgi:hypothetical protein
MTIDCEAHRRDAYLEYQAWPCDVPWVRFGDSCVLEMVGCPVGRISKSFKLTWDPERSIRDSCIKFLETATSAFGSLDENKRTIFWRTIMSDLLDGNDNGDPQTRMSKQTSFSFDMWLTEEKADSIMDSRVSNSITNSIWGRDFFITEEGSFGLCPSGTRPGGEVWVIVGGNVPFILCPRSEEGGKYHTFIGDCYMDGVMDGEVKDNPLYVECTALIK